MSDLNKGFKLGECFDGFSEPFEIAPTASAPAQDLLSALLNSLNTVAAQPAPAVATGVATSAGSIPHAGNAIAKTASSGITGSMKNAGDILSGYLQALPSIIQGMIKVLGWILSFLTHL